MIKSITFTNRFNRSLRCELAAPELSGFAITKIDGLGPGKATVNVHDIVTADGGYPGTSRFSSRNIVLNITLLDYDAQYKYIPIEQVRHRSYEFFAPKTKLRMLIETDTRTLSIIGVVESNEPDIFSQKQAIVVSIICPSYYLKMVNNGRDVQTVDVYRTSRFEFPFSNESLKTEVEPAKKLIQFGVSNEEEVYSLFYDGDADNGFKLTIIFDGSVVTGAIIVTNEPTGRTGEGNIGFRANSDVPAWLSDWSDEELSNGYISVNIDTLALRLSDSYSGHIYDSGNRIEICTETGKKSAKFISGSNEYNIFGYLDQLDWLKLYPGYNNVHVVCNAASASHFRASMVFECLYSGV